MSACRRLAQIGWLLELTRTSIRLASRAVLPRHDAKPGSELVALMGAVPFPIAATMAVAVNRLRPGSLMEAGLFGSRRAEIRFGSSPGSSSCWSTVFRSLQSVSIRCVFSAASQLRFPRRSRKAAFSVAGDCFDTRPCSSKIARIWSITAVRRESSRSRRDGSPPDSGAGSPDKPHVLTSGLAAQWVTLASLVNKRSLCRKA